MIKLPSFIPGPTEIIREALIVMAGVTVAALVISYFPAWQRRIQDASITVKDSSGKVLF